MAEYGEFFRGIGISENELTKFYTMVNVDVHTSSGKAQCSKALENIGSGNNFTTEPVCSIVLSNGDAFFGVGAKIMKVANSVVSLVHTSTNGDVLGMGEHKDVFYYATATKLGKITVALASSQATWTSNNDTWATFSNQKAHKPMVWVNQILCIGDGNYVAIVDENEDFLANALDILDREVITAIHNMNDYLAIGTFVNSAVHQASFYNWDTYSPSWTEDYKLLERGVNMFFDIDGYTYAQCGSIGNIYQWTGERAVMFLPLRDANEAIETEVNPYGVTNLNGLTLIATKRGIFSFGKISATMPLAMVIEYVSTRGQGYKTGALEAIGSDLLVGHLDGIDNISDNYATGKITIPETDGKQNKIFVGYTDMPTGCSITAKVNPDNSAYATIKMVQDDSNMREYYSDVHVNNKSTVQAEIYLNPVTTETPVIKVIKLI